MSKADRDNQYKLAGLVKIDDAYYRNRWPKNYNGLGQLGYQLWEPELFSTGSLMLASLPGR